jgi:hypothetical protein
VPRWPAGGANRHLLTATFAGDESDIQVVRWLAHASDRAVIRGARGYRGQ